MSLLLARRAFDEKLRAQLENYLIHLEILEPKQALNFHEARTTGSSQPMSLFE